MQCERTAKQTVRMLADGKRRHEALMMFTPSACMLDSSTSFAA